MSIVEPPVKKAPRRIVPTLVSPPIALPLPVASPPVIQPGSKLKLTMPELLGFTLMNKIQSQVPWDYSDLTNRVQQLNTIYAGRYVFTEDDLDEPLGDFIKSQRVKRGESFLAKYEAMHQQEAAQVAELMNKGYSEDEAYRMLDKALRKKKKRSRSPKRSLKKSPKKMSSKSRSDLAHTKALLHDWKIRGKQSVNLQRSRSHKFKRLRKVGGYSNLNKTQLVDFILDNINTSTGLLIKGVSPKKRSRSKSPIKRLTANRESLMKQTIAGLKDYIKRRGFHGYSGLNKSQLVDFIMNKAKFGVDKARKSED